ncbi:MAG: phosphatase PAP2 family protein [Fimbriimonas sp.]
MRSVDLAVFRWINHWPEGQAPFWVFLSEATQSPVVKAILGVLVLGMLFGGPQTRRTILLTLVAVVLANELTDVLKNLFPTPRPYQSPAVADVLVRCGLSENPGTASAHSANMAAVATIFTLNLRFWGLPWVAIALLTGFSRSYVAAHYPSQVLLGWLCGISVALLAHWTYARILARRESVKKENGLETA